MKNRSVGDLSRLYRVESAKVIAALMHQCRDLALVEDALQDALLQACQQWPEQGLPENCAAWLHSVAKRRLIDRLRRERVRHAPNAQHMLTESYQWRYSEATVHLDIPDDRLRLIFTCCHPALAQQAQVALTLKIICGLDSRTIANAFLISEETLNRRLSRSKIKIASAGIAYEVPEGKELQARLPVVLAVIYLLFNASYRVATEADESQEDLGLESIRLGRLLYQLQPSCEAGGLLALMELHRARHISRTSEGYTYIPLDSQDRRGWDHDVIERSCDFLFQTMSRGETGPYQIQAAISALHARAKSFSQVDWPQVAGLYAQLYRIQATPVVALNHCVARSYLQQGPEHVVCEMKALGETLANYQPYHAACADIYRRTNNHGLAKNHYLRAIELSDNSAEQEFLQSQMNLLSPQS